LIEISVARTGASVLKRDGRFLASAFDPIQEAAKWAEQVHKEVATDAAVIVVGVGSGYHVAALKSLRPKCEILALDNSPEVVSQALKICPALLPNDVLVEPDWLKLPNHARFCDVACGVYGVANHGPSLQIDPAYFTAVDRLLRGRDKLSFLVLLKARPELLASLDPQEISAIGEEAVSIKTIRRLFSPAGSASRERRLWRVLEELVT
jgi:hypothetical protein